MNTRNASSASGILDTQRRYIVSAQELNDLCSLLVQRLCTEWLPSAYPLRIYGIPKSGSIVAAHMQGTSPNIILVYNPEEADCFVDDIIDTGRTQKLYYDRYKKNTYALFGKGASLNCLRSVPPTQWVEFPWESEEQTNKEHQDFVVRLIEELGENASRKELQDTPARFLESWREMTRGYTMEVNLKAIATEESLFPTDTHGMIIVRDIDFHSLCEHHLLPFVGKIHVGYLPNKHTIGHSKIPRIVEMYARRLQVQERLGQQICDALAHVLQPKGIGVLIEGSHFCMLMRGVKKEHATIMTSHLKGIFSEDARTRQEFLQLVHH